jgi:hypothetical protein
MRSGGDNQLVTTITFGGLKAILVPTDLVPASPFA